MPTSISPIAVSKVSEPRPASRTRTAPFAVFASTSSLASSTVMSPLAERTLTAPRAVPINVQPAGSGSDRGLAGDAVAEHVARRRGHRERSSFVELHVAEAGLVADVAE